MKTWIVVISILLIVGFALFTFAKALSKSVFADYKIVKFDLHALLKGYLGIYLDVYLTNISSLRLDIRNVYFELYYQNQLIAVTPKDNINIFVASNVSNYLAINGANIELDLNKSFSNLINKYLDKQPIPLRIKLKARLFLIPISITTDFVYNEYK